jgi:uncharacterized protein (TIGR03435 family)
VEKEMRRLNRKVVLVVVAVLTAVVPLAAQVPGKKPSFEGLSIKPTTSGGMLSLPPVMMGSRFVATNVTLKDLVFFAYAPQSGNFLYDQIVGGPDWIDGDHFDLEAQVKGNSGAIARDKMQAMARALLEDSFQLKLHRDTQNLTVLNLVVSDSGVKMKLSEDQTPPTGQSSTTYDSSGQNGEQLLRGSMKVSTNLSGTTITSRAVTVSRLASALQGQLGRMVFDKTDLKGLFDFNLRFSRQDLTPSLANQPGTSLVTAIQELGLKLETAKAPLEVLVIDSVQKPSKN